MSYRLDVLDTGYSNSRFGICCPDCEFEENKTIHILCNMDERIRLSEYSADCFLSGCCTNIYTTNDTFQAYLDTIGELGLSIISLEITNIGDNVLARTTGETACVNNNFYNCITQISGLCTDFSVFVDRGITEIGTLSGTSAICILKDYIITNSLTQSEAQDLLELFFVSMVTSCIDTQIIIGSIPIWALWAEVVGGLFCDIGPPAAIV